MKRTTLIYLSIFVLLGVGGLLGAWDGKDASAAPDDTWIPATPLPLLMGGGVAHCADMPDSFYLVSGLEEGNVTSDKILRYDISAGTWTQLASMPEALRMVALTCYQGKIYAAGGWESTVRNSLYIYDIALNTWNKGPDLPDEIWAAGMGAWDGKLYLVGGSRGGFYAPESRVDVYDIASGVWTSGGGANMPTPSGFFAYAQNGPYLYVVGGYSAVEPVNVDQTQRYDMRNDDWEVGPTFTSARALGTLAVTSSHIYMLGGDLNLGGIMDETTLVEVLDTTAWPAGSWSDLGDPLPTANFYPGTTCSETLGGGEIWDVGGVDATFTPFDEVYYRLTGEPCQQLIYDLKVAPESDENTGLPDETLVYTLRVTNTGFAEDTIEISSSGNAWTTTFPETTGLIYPGEAAEVEISVTIPADAVWGETDTAVLTFTSQGDPAKEDTAALTTSVTEWYPVADLPYTLGLSANVQCMDEPNYLYVIGGAEGYDSPTHYAFRYDVLADSWEQLADLPVDAFGLAGICVEGKIYVVDWEEALRIYDIATDTWSTETGVPRTVEGAALGAWEGKLYLAGGSASTHYGASDQVDIYDIATHTWTEEGGTTMPQATTYAGAVQTGPYLYLAGGMSERYVPVPLIQRYDMIHDSWLTAAYPSNMVFPALIATADYLYVLGGDPPGDEVWTASKLVERLALGDWLSGDWKAYDPLLIPSMGASTFCTDALVEGEIWHIGGGTGSGGVTYTDSLYHPAESCWQLTYDLTATPVSEVKLGQPGETLEYTLTVTNAGSVGDTFDIALSGNLWVTTAPTTTGWLEPGETFEALVSVSIPLDAVIGDGDTATLTFTSQGDEGISAVVTLTTRVPWQFYLPLVARLAP